MNVLKEGIEKTLSQVRHYAGHIEESKNGNHDIVRRKNSTVKFTVKRLDRATDNFPSMAEIARANFSQDVLGDHELLSNSPMTFGRKPEAHPDNHPAMCSFRANLIPGGIIFMSHGHHYANGVGGWSSFTEQTAENCLAVFKGTEMPYFDSRCLDRRIFTNLGYEKPSPSEVEASESSPKAQPPPPGSEDQSHRRPLQSVFFHLPNSKAAILKKEASPKDGTWISTYDAVCAHMWRVFSRIREPLYQPGRNFKPLLGTGVSMRRMPFNPPMPEKMQGNIQFDITSATSPVPSPTLDEVISTAPLPKLAGYLRQLTGSVTIDMIAEKLQKVAHVRNKPDLSISVDTMPPMAQYITDWRGTKVTTFDFGFAKPIAYRHLFSMVLANHCIVYPPRNRGPAGQDEGIELQVTFEEELVDQLVNDPEWSKYFEFRGVDLWEEGRKTLQAKL